MKVTLYLFSVLAAVYATDVVPHAEENTVGTEHQPQVRGNFKEGMQHLTQAGVDSARHVGNLGYAVGETAAEAGHAALGAGTLATQKTGRLAQGSGNVVLGKTKSMFANQVGLLRDGLAQTFEDASRVLYQAADANDQKARGHYDSAAAGEYQAQLGKDQLYQETKPVVDSAQTVYDHAVEAKDQASASLREGAAQAKENIADASERTTNAVDSKAQEVKAGTRRSFFGTAKVAHQKAANAFSGAAAKAQDIADRNLAQAHDDEVKEDHARKDQNEAAHLVVEQTGGALRNVAIGSIAGALAIAALLF